MEGSPELWAIFLFHFLFSIVRIGPKSLILEQYFLCSRNRSVRKCMYVHTWRWKVLIYKETKEKLKKILQS